MHMTTTGIILREVDYKESDKILTVLTEQEGKLTVSARGCRKKGGRSAGTQLLVYSDMTLSEYRGRWTLQEAAPRQLFDAVRGDVVALSLGAYFAEFTELIAQEGIAAPEVLSLLLNSLYAMDKLQKPGALVKPAFELKLMSLAGFEPLLDACTVCGREPEEPRLHLREGVLHCAQCRGEVGDGVSLPLDKDVLAAMRYILYGDPKRLFSFTLPPEKLGQLGDVCEAYVLAQLERGFGTLDFYKKMCLTLPQTLT